MEKQHGIELDRRCRKCNAALYTATVVKSPLGLFCSEVCRDSFHTFAERAQELDKMKPMFRPWLSFKRILSKLIALAVLLVFIAIAASVVNIPVLSPLVDRLRDMLGF